MNMDRQKVFKINELAKLFNVSTDIIRYYEKQGLITPIRNEENNYRYYTIEDVKKLMMIRELLGLNFSLEQIKDFDTNRNLETTRKMLKEELNVVNAAIVDLFEKRTSIESRLDALEKSNQLKDIEKVNLIHAEERHCLMISNSDLPDNYVDYYLIKYMHNQKKKVDTIGACDCYTLDIENSNPESPYLRTKNVFFYSPTILYQSNYTLPEGKYLSLIYRGPLSKTKQLMSKLYDYAKSHRLETIGDPIEFCHIDEYETSIEAEYMIELQIRVK